jgi:cytochrome c556
MKRTLGLAAASIALAVATLAYAQGNVIEERQALMKANGGAMGVLSPMARGEAPFDAAAAKQAFETIQHDMEQFPALFPEGSDTGDTKAGPAIWTDRAGFEALAAGLATAAGDAATSVTSLEELQTAMGTVGGFCGECHSKYRN